MKRTDKEMLDMLQSEFAKSAEGAKIPLKLQKESVVAMLKNSEKERDKKDFSAKTGAGNGNKIVVLRRLTAVAAVLVVVVAAALFMRTGGVKVIRTDSFYKGYEDATPVRNAQNYEEVERAVSEILDSKKEDKKPQTGDKNSTSDSTQTTIDRLIEGYSRYVADNGKAEGEKQYQPEKTEAKVDGVVSSDDFEADIVKTDGKYLYIVTTGADEKTGRAVEQIKIVKAVPAEGMQVVSTIVLADGTKANVIDECIEIYLKNNRLIALVNSYSYSMGSTAAYDSTSTSAVYYDISDPTAPVKIREHIQDGKYVSSGLYENRFCLVTTRSIPSAAVNGEIDTSQIIPSYTVDGKKVRTDAENIFIAVNDPEESFLFVTVTDIDNMQANVGKLAILGSGKEVYSSANTLAVARGFVSVDADSDGKHNSLTEIYRFSITESGIGFAGSYVVQGSLIGGITADEKTGNIKVATSDAGANNFYVLNKKMEFVSGLTGIFSGKKIKSVKYIGSNAYFVSGDDEEKTMIIDISDPSKPKVAGNISTEGFSRELYAVSDTALLGIGTTEGKATKISLFDVSNPGNPVVASEYVFEGESVMPVSADSRCVMLDTKNKLFGIPVVMINPSADTEVSAYILFSVADGKITPVGTYNHDTSSTGDAAVRGICIDKTLYTVSGEKVTAFGVDESTVISSQKLR